MNFQKTIKEKLAHYKKDVLNVDENGINGNDGYKKPYAHILPVKFNALNIIEYYRDDFFSSKYAGIDYHDCFHHLNSSQAMCINLFYPLIHEQLLNLLLEILEIPGKPVRTAEFEKLSPVEQTTGRKTNFDFYIELTDGTRIFFEVKYTEQKFGDADHDHRHIAKFEKTYLPLLRNNPFIREEYKTMDLFLENYQIMRNLVHIGKTDYVVFLYPEANMEIHKQALLAAEKIVTERGKEHLKLLAMEVTLEHIVNCLKTNRLMCHFNEFEQKYLHASITN